MTDLAGATKKMKHLACSVIHSRYKSDKIEKKCTDKKWVWE